MSNAGSRIYMRETITMATKTTAAKTRIATAVTTTTTATHSSTSKGASVKSMATRKTEAVVDFDPTETPTGKYKPGKIRDRNLTNIINAAEEEFVQNGFRGASIQNIADRAGIPKANVHYYFKSKTNLSPLAYRQSFN